MDILKFINVLFGRDVIYASQYYLKKCFDGGEDSAVMHMFCSKCEMSLGTRGVVEEEQILQCPNCGQTVKEFAKSSSYFVSIKFQDQFKRFMELPGVAQEMSYRFQMPKANNESLDDIFDGSEYLSLCENEGPLSDPKNLSVIVNTDNIASSLANFFVLRRT